DRIELVVEVIAVDRGDGALFLRKVRNLHLHLRLARANDENGIVGQIDSRHEDVVVLFAEFLVVDSRRDALPVGERAASEQNRCDDDEATFHDHAARVFKSPACIIRSPFAVRYLPDSSAANGQRLTAMAPPMQKCRLKMASEFRPTRYSRVNPDATGE